MKTKLFLRISWQKAKFFHLPLFAQKFVNKFGKNGEATKLNSNLPREILFVEILKARHKLILPSQLVII